MLADWISDIGDKCFLNKMTRKFKNKDRDKKNNNSVKKIGLHPETKNGILIVLLVVLIVISILSYFNRAGVLGEYFLKTFTVLFGWGYFLIPTVLLFSVFSLLKSLHKDIYFFTLVGASLFLVSFLGVLQIIIKDGGGLAGYFITLPLLKLLGVYAAVVILVALIIISVIVAFNLSLASIWNFITGKNKLKEMEKNKVALAGVDQPLPLAAESKLLGKFFTNSDKPKFKINNLDENSGGNRSEIREAKPETKSESVVRMNPNKTLSNFQLPDLDLLDSDKGSPLSGDIRASANIIKRTLQNFNIEVEMAEVNVGPTVAQYTLRPAQGVKLSKISALQNDLALALAARSLRIEAPIPGRSLVGIEVPNKVVTKVRMRNILEQPEFNEGPTFLSLALGRDVAGNSVFAALEKMPHMMIAGATGAGKTICLNSIIVSLLYKHSPDILKLILIDPKRVEFPIYNDLPHLLAPVIVESEKTINVLRWAVTEMERRFDVLSQDKSRDIGVYNGKHFSEPLPYIVIIIDELADLMASHGRDVEGAIVRLAQMARAVGIHLVVATQRPSVEVLTGLIKANITSRVAFQVASQVDSRTILDSSGAEKLLGNGDMLFLSGDANKPRRIQGTYVSDKEIKRMVDFIKEQKEPEYDERVLRDMEKHVAVSGNGNGAEMDVDDALYNEAKEVVIQAGKASASLLQRRLRVGYARAARLIDLLEERGIVGPGDGAKPREVFGDVDAILAGEDNEA